MKFEIDIDPEEVLGIKNTAANLDGIVTSNPYSTPSSAFDQANPNQMKLSFFIWFFSLLQILSSAMLLTGIGSLVFSTADSRVGNGIIYFIGAICAYQLVAYTGLLAKQNWARKMVLIHSYVMLVAIPLGTIIGIMFIRRLKNKTF